jgi:hypothetical protein
MGARGGAGFGVSAGRDVRTDPGAERQPLGDAGALGRKRPNRY